MTKKIKTIECNYIGTPKISSVILKDDKESINFIVDDHVI